MNAARRAAAGLVLLLLAACTPHVETAGPPVQAPEVASDALVMADGYRLPTRSWGPADSPKAVILALHGFNDYSNAFANAGEFWAGRGIRTLAYDQRGFGETAGHGLWHGGARLARDARAAIRLVRARHPRAPLVLFGESMGGAVAVRALAAEDAPPVAGTVLSAPAIMDREAVPWWQRAGLWLMAHSLPWLELTGEGLDIKPSDNTEMLRRLARDPLVVKATRVDALWGLTRLMDAAYAAAPRLPGPALVLYGANEELIPERARRALRDRLPETAAQRTYPDGYHMLTRDLNADAVLADVAVWTLALPGGPAAADAVAAAPTPAPSP